MEVNLPRPEEDPHTAKGRGRRRRLRLRAGAVDVPLLRLWPEGFALDAGGPLPARGFVDIFDGDTQLIHALAYQTAAEGGRAIFRFKIVRDARLGQPRDYAGPEGEPAALIPDAR